MLVFGWFEALSGFRYICIVCNNAILQIFCCWFIASAWIHHKQLFYKLLVQNRYFVPIPVFEHQKHLTGSLDHGIVSPSCNIRWMCLHKGLQLVLARPWSRIWDYLMPQFWMSGASLYSSAERPFFAPGPLERLCRVAFCCTRTTWKASAEWLFVALGPLGRLEQAFVAPGSLGRLCRVAFCCTRATWKARAAFCCTRVTWKALQSGFLLH